jgi:protein SCO1/2
MGSIQGLSLNRDFRIVTVSFNADETPARTKEKAMETHAMLRGITNPESRWPFLMGNQPEIDRLTSAVGFRYVKLAKDNFAHPAAIILLTPEGRVARYLYGLEQSPRDLKLALIEAADGRIGGSQLLNRALLYCFHYDPEGRKYALAAVNIMKVTGGVVVLLLGILIFSLWRREKKGAGGRGGN